MLDHCDKCGQARRSLYDSQRAQRDRNRGMGQYAKCPDKINGLAGPNQTKTPIFAISGIGDAMEAAGILEAAGFVVQYATGAA